MVKWWCFLGKGRILKYYLDTLWHTIVNIVLVPCFYKYQILGNINMLIGKWCVKLF
jgi:hypothetical protein